MITGTSALILERDIIIKEQKAEIERLKAELRKVETLWFSENYRMRDLLKRAAEALEFWMKDLASTEQQYVDAAMRDERLLAELRKAAE